jgi:hypothetical protein
MQVVMFCLIKMTFPKGCVSHAVVEIEIDLFN